jgi:hypothetical protein
MFFALEVSTMERPDGVTDAGPSRAQHQTCFAPQLLRPPHSIDLERHINQVYPEEHMNIRRRPGGDQGSGFWKANLPTILVPRACF